MKLKLSLLAGLVCVAALHFIPGEKSPLDNIFIGMAGVIVAESCYG